MEIRPKGWLAVYTTELLNVLDVLGRLGKAAPEQAKLLVAICAGPRITRTELDVAEALECPPIWKESMRVEAASLFD